MSAALAQISPRFVRRTTLSDDEYRVNFKQIDNDVIISLTSVEAREVTPLMATIYLALLAAPKDCWERTGVLHFIGEDREEGHLTAWEQMRRITSVANSTLSKALDWMRKSGVIGYDARANGIGIRIFINRATSSIRQSRQGAQNVRQGSGQGIETAQKNLSIVPTPSSNAPTPINGAPFKEHGVEKDLENYFPRASARIESLPVQVLSDDGSPSSPKAPTEKRAEGDLRHHGQAVATTTKPNIGRQNHQDFEFLKSQKNCEIDPKLVTALTRRIASELRPEILTAVKRETDDAREWFIKYGLPKATRVAQRETYDLLRAQGVIAKRKASSDVGRYDETSGKGREGKREIESIAVFLAEIGAAVRRAADDPDTSGKRELRAVFLAVAGELDGLRDRVQAGAHRSPEETESQLAALEKQVTEAMWRATDEAELNGILITAKNELTEYAARMETGAFEETVRRRVAARLRERHGVPRFSLFYA